MKGVKPGSQSFMQAFIFLRHASGPLSIHTGVFSFQFISWSHDLPTGSWGSDWIFGDQGTEVQYYIY